ncbi:hypothetical protein BSKO_03321 [Bryopsis sp. KO-2023]|nr:hypothetical protein BSKO_03321 [Bryopsis sp. KO-2023]
MVPRISTVARVVLAIVCACSAAVLASRVQSDSPDTETERIAWWLVGLEFTALLFWLVTEVFKWTSLRLVVAGLFGAGLALQGRMGAESESLARVCHFVLVVANSFLVALVGYQKRAVWPEQRDGPENGQHDGTPGVGLESERDVDGLGLRVAPFSDMDPDLISSTALRPGSVISESSEDTVNVSESVTLCNCSCSGLSPLLLGQVFGALGLVLGLTGALTGAVGWAKICEDLHSCGDDYVVPLWWAVVQLVCLLIAYVWAVGLRRTRDILPLYTIFMAVPVGLGARFANLARAGNEVSPHPYYVAGATGCSLMVVAGYLLVLALVIPSCSWEVPAPVRTRGIKALGSIGTIVALSATLVGLREADARICNGEWTNVDCDRTRLVWVELKYAPFLLILGLVSVFAEPGMEVRAGLIILPIVSLSAYPASTSQFLKLWKDGMTREEGGYSKDSSFGFTATCYGMLCVANLFWLLLWGWEVPGGEEAPEEKDIEEVQESVLSELYDTDGDINNNNVSPVTEERKSRPGPRASDEEIQIEMSNMM